MITLGNLFGSGDSPLIGMDISSSSVKVLELSRKGETYHVQAYAAEALPTNAVVDKQVTEVEPVTAAIVRAIERSGSRTKDVAVAVAGSSVITKVIQMSAAMKDHEMEEQLKLEADQYIPYPIEEVNLDFQVLGPNPRDEESVDVLLAACRSDTVDSRVAAVEMAGLKVKVVDIEAYAMESACDLIRHQMPNGGQDETIALVDVGASTMSVLITHDNETIYTRDQAFGGKQLTEDIMRHYGMTYEEAGKAQKYGNLPENYESEVLTYFIDDMTQQIDRALQFFYSSSSGHDNVDKLLLAGGCANIEGIAGKVAETTGVTTEVVDPFSSMEVSSRAATGLKTDATTLMIAAGLAMRAFD